MSDKIINATDATFEQEVLKSAVPVLVDFWAPWCGPCKAMAPTLDVLADEFDGKVKIVKVDVDQNFDIPGKHRVRGIPTLILFKNGEAIKTLVGSQTKAKLTEFITAE